MSEEQLSWTHLEQLGLAVTYRQVPASGWGYTWRGRSWEGPYETQMTALAAACSRAIDSLLLAIQSETLSLSGSRIQKEEDHVSANSSPPGWVSPC